MFQNFPRIAKNAGFFFSFSFFVEKQADHIITVTKACQLASVSNLKFWRELTANMRDEKKQKLSGDTLMQVCSQWNKIYFDFILALFAAIGSVRVTGVFRILSNI